MSERLTVIANRPVTQKSAPSKVDIARQRFGQPFVHEPGSRWKPQAEPFLTRWLRERGK